MASASGYSKRSSSVKRLLQEAKELASTSHEGIHAAPFEEDMYNWHFTIEGPKDSEFDGGLYHGRITLPPQYPFKAPDIMLLTPNGRFELNKKVCLTITGFHEESWQPAWGIRTALVGLSSFFTTEAKGAIGGLDAPASERKRLAALSRDWTCPGCQIKNCEILPPRTEDKKPSADLTEDKANTEVAEPKVAVQAASSKAEDTGAEAGVVEAPKAVAQVPPAVPAGDTSSSSPPQASSSSRTTVSSQVPSQQRQEPPAQHASSASSNSTSFTSRPNRTGSLSRQEVVDRHLQVVELLTRQLALNDPSASTSATATTNVHHAPTVGQSVAIAAPAGASNGRANGGAPDTRASAPPMWLDGAIGAVLIALASLIFRKVM
ncbi:UBC-like protein [Cystobasidium minutum MCA 4210]|uniref:UBC-like protein n=1 Tax=Cystobasidium minutum MCA 4210 TaxID=1397322 RepID=UPI0034CE4312|eukprot:jgi/Rhomi1/156179/estExt_Genewise1.C_100166